MLLLLFAGAGGGVTPIAPVRAYGMVSYGLANGSAITYALNGATGGIVANGAHGNITVTTAAQGAEQRSTNAEGDVT